jgi:integrase
MSSISPKYKFVLKGSFSKKGEKYIFIRYAFMAETRWLSSKISIKPEYWDAKKELIKSSFDMSYSLNGILLDLKTRINAFIGRCLSSGQKPYFNDLVNELNYGKSTKNESQALKLKDLVEIIDQAFTEKKISKSTQHAYKSAVLSFRIFIKKDIHLSQITPEIINLFRQHLIETKNENTGAQYIRFFQAAWKLIKVVRKINIDAPTRFESTPVERMSEKKVLTIDEYNKIKQYYVETKNEYIRRFLVLCKGIRCSDSNKIKISDIQQYENKEIWYYTVAAQKTGVKGVIIFDKWDMENIIPKNKEFLFKKMTTSNFNIGLKQVLELVIGRKITSHFGRHFAGDQIINDDSMDREDVKIILGISSTSISEIYAQRKIITTLKKIQENDKNRNSK